MYELSQRIQKEYNIFKDSIISSYTANFPAQQFEIAFKQR